MNRKIEWRSMELDEIELVYEKAENNHNIETLLEQLETQALEEAKNNMGMLKTDTGNVLKPEQFESLSDTDKETVKDESENNCPYEYSEGMPPKGFGLPKELAALLPNPDRIIITSFSSAGNTFGTRMRFGFGMNGMNDIYKAQNFIQYRCKRSKNSEQAQNCTSLFADSFHPFVQRYANDISGCVENILHSIMYTPISYELTDGILNAYLDSGYHETYYQETSEYIRFNDRYQESFHDGGGNGFEEWYVYAASITEYKTEISDVIGYKHFSAWPSASLPYCRGFWTEDGHVYLVDPWGLSGIFEFYHYSEGRPDAFSEEEIEIVGTPYKKQT